MEKSNEQKILKPKHIALYDFEATKSALDKLMTKYDMLEFKYLNIKPPKITASYELRFECHTINRSDALGNYVARKLDTESEVEELYANITEACNRLSPSEQVYFISVYLNGKSEAFVMERLNICRYTFETLRKSAIVRMSLSLSIAVRNPQIED